MDANESIKTVKTSIKDFRTNNNYHKQNACSACIHVEWDEKTSFWECNLMALATGLPLKDCPVYDSAVCNLFQRDKRLD